MKRLGAVLLLCIYTAGATELEQLFRLPLLVQHYRIHKAANPEITIAQFLTIHYVGIQPFDDDYNEDMQLPFKQSDEHCLSFYWQMPASPVFIPLIREPFRCKHILLNDNIPPSLYRAVIFKPPILPAYTVT